jgi:hypothetical protein
MPEEMFNLKEIRSIYSSVLTTLGEPFLSQKILKVKNKKEMMRIVKDDK